MDKITAPCPFCGMGSGVYEDNKPNLVVKRQSDIGSYRVICRWCGALGPIARDEDKAIELWNQRAKE